MIRLCDMLEMSSRLDHTLREKLQQDYRKHCEKNLRGNITAPQHDNVHCEKIFTGELIGAPLQQHLNMTTIEISTRL